MILRVTFKTPDVAQYALDEITDENELQKAKEVLEKYVRFDELITVLFDTESQTATVAEN